jgi:hypothetical protein
MLPPLSIPDTIKVLRSRYPDALVCVQCGLLLATRRESYAKSNLTEQQRLEYVCHECRHEQTAAERVRVQRVAQAALAREAAKIRRLPEVPLVTLAPDAPYTCCGDPRLVPRDRNPRPGGDDHLHRAILDPPPAHPHKQRGFEQGLYHPATRNPRQGGRPRKHATALIARCEAQRAYRQRQREKEVSPVSVAR